MSEWTEYAEDEGVTALRNHSARAVPYLTAFAKRTRVERHFWTQDDAQLTPRTTRAQHATKRCARSRVELDGRGCESIVSHAYFRTQLTGKKSGIPVQNMSPAHNNRTLSGPAFLPQLVVQVHPVDTRLAYNV